MKHILCILFIKDIMAYPYPLPNNFDHIPAAKNFEDSLYRSKSVFYQTDQSLLKFSRFITILICQNKFTLEKCKQECEELEKIGFDDLKNWKIRRQYAMCQVTIDICETNQIILTCIKSQIEKVAALLKSIDMVIFKLEQNTSPWGEHFTYLPSQEIETISQLPKFWSWPDKLPLPDFLPQPPKKHINKIKNPKFKKKIKNLKFPNKFLPEGFTEPSSSTLFWPWLEQNLQGRSIFITTNPATERINFNNPPFK